MSALLVMDRVCREEASMSALIGGLLFASTVGIAGFLLVVFFSLHILFFLAFVFFCSYLYTCSYFVYLFIYIFLDTFYLSFFCMF